MPSAGGTQTLPRIAGPGVAAHLILAGEPADAMAALRWRIVDAVVPVRDLDAAVAARVEDALAGAPKRRVH